MRSKAVMSVMTVMTWMSVATGLVLGLAFQTAARAEDQGAGKKFDRQPIEVAVVDGKIKVAEEEAHTTDRHKALVWKVSTPGYAFATDGIAIDSKGQHRCTVLGEGDRFHCAKLSHIQGEKYKYIVKLRPLAGAKAVDALDPWLIND